MNFLHDLHTEVGVHGLYQC